MAANVIHVANARELVRDVEALFPKLDPQTDWDARMAALKRLEGLFRGGTCSPCIAQSSVKLGDLEFDAEQVSEIVVIKVSLYELAVRFNACNLVSAIAECLSGEFEPCADIVLQELMKLLGSSAAIMADSADSTIRTVVMRCRPARTLSKVFETARASKSTVVRSRCAEYVLLALEVWGPQGELVMLVDAIESSIRSGVQDSTREVRATARRSFREFSHLWPERAARLHSSFDVTVQKVLAQEDKSAALAAGPAGRGERIGPQRVISTSETGTAAGPAAADSDDYDVEYARDGVSSGGGSPGSELNLSPKIVRVLDFDSASRSAGAAAAAGVGAGSAAGVARVSVDDVPMKENVQGRWGGAAAAGGGDCGVGPRRQRHSIAASTNLEGLVPSQLLGTAANRVGRGALGEREAEGKGGVGVRTGNVSGGGIAGGGIGGVGVGVAGGERRVVHARRPARRSVSSSYGAGGMGATGGAGAIGGTRLTGAIGARGGAVGAAGVGGGRDRTQRNKPQQHQDVGEEMRLKVEEGLRKGCDWSRRVAALEAVRGCVMGGGDEAAWGGAEGDGVSRKGVQAVVKHLDRVVELLVAGMEFAHTKVAASALALLEDLVLHCPPILTPPHLDKWLPPLFSRMADTGKDRMRAHAEGILLRRLKNTLTSLELLVTGMEFAHTKVASAALALLEDLVLHCPPILTPPHLDKWLPPLFSRVADTGKDRMRAQAEGILDCALNSWFRRGDGCGGVNGGLGEVGRSGEGLRWGEGEAVQVLLPVLERALEGQRGPRVRVCVVEFAEKVLRGRAGREEEREEGGEEENGGEEEHKGRQRGGNTAVRVRRSTVEGAPLVSGKKFEETKVIHWCQVSDVLYVMLERALEGQRGPRVRVCVVEFAEQVLRGRAGREEEREEGGEGEDGGEEEGEGGRQRCGSALARVRKSTAEAKSIRQWGVRLLPLLKDPKTRLPAARCLGEVVAQMGPVFLAAHIDSLPDSELTDFLALLDRAAQPDVAVAVAEFVQGSQIHGHGHSMSAAGPRHERAPGAARASATSADSGMHIAGLTERDSGQVVWEGGDDGGGVGEREALREDEGWEEGEDRRGGEGAGEESEQEEGGDEGGDKERRAEGEMYGQGPIAPGENTVQDGMDPFFAAPQKIHGEEPIATGENGVRGGMEHSSESSFLSFSVEEGRLGEDREERGTGSPAHNPSFLPSYAPLATDDFAKRDERLLDQGPWGGRAESGEGGAFAGGEEWVGWEEEREEVDDAWVAAEIADAMMWATGREEMLDVCGEECRLRLGDQDRFKNEKANGGERREEQSEMDVVEYYSSLVGVPRVLDAAIGAPEGNLERISYVVSMAAAD
ncbi:unnamed protein product [Closterium sp. NIES-64]|nr:unnamed protein product [Closterium sp. NIES-64]